MTVQLGNRGSRRLQAFGGFGKTLTEYNFRQTSAGAGVGVSFLLF